MSAGALRQDRAGWLVGLAGSMVVHAMAVVVVLLAALHRPPPTGPVYAVNLVAAPPTTAPAPAVAPTPRPPSAVERTAPIQPPARSARPAPVLPRSQPAPRAEPAPQAAAPPMPGEAGTGSDAVTLSTPGADFPYPEYLRNVVNQIHRRWSRPLGSPALRTEVTFLILRDGTVREISVATRSRSYSFDQGAQGAVEAAGNAKAFGPLPEGFRGDVLQVSLWFVPRSGS